MYNNLTFLSIPLNKAQLLIHLTLWTFSVGSYSKEGVGWLRYSPCKGVLVLGGTLLMKEGVGWLRYSPCKGVLVVAWRHPPYKGVLLVEVFLTYSEKSPPQTKK